MDVWEYFDQFERKCVEMSVDARDLRFYAEGGSDDQIGHLLGPIYFAEDAYLDAHERVEVHGSHVHRTDYAYFFIMDGVEYWGWERDPSHDPPDHRHTYKHEERLPAEPISFKRACELAWHEVSLRESGAL